MGGLAVPRPVGNTALAQFILLHLAGSARSISDQLYVGQRAGHACHKTLATVSAVELDLRPRVGYKTIAIGHLDVRETLCIEHSVLRHDTGFAENVGDHAIHLLISERPGHGERHRALDVVE